MVQLIAFIIFVITSSAVVVMLYKKMPALAQLPQNGHHGFKKPHFISTIEKKVKDHHFHFFKKQMLLHKFLSQVRIMILKIERKIDSVLQSIRRKAQEIDKKTKGKK